MKSFFLFVFLIGLHHTIWSQKSDLGNWYIYLGNFELNSRWNIHHEIQYRNYNFIGDLQQLLLRAGIGYNLSEGNNYLLLGYGFIRSGNYSNNLEEKIYSNEHRIYQQFITRQQFGRVYLQHRYRVEERFIKEELTLRYRYFLAANIPLTKSKMEKSAVYASAYNEIFVNNSGPALDRNRIYGALGYVFSKRLKLELGYMNQIQPNKSRGQIQMVIFSNLDVFRYKAD